MLKSAAQSKRVTGVEQPSTAKPQKDAATSLTSRLATILWLLIGEITGQKRNLNL